MPNLIELKERKAAKVAEMRSLNDKALGESRDLNEAEKTAWTALDKEVRAISEQITRADHLAELERHEPGQAVTGGASARELRGYSVAKAIQESMAGRLTGLEAEVHSDLAKGRETRGVMVPTNVLLEHRAVLTTTPVAGPGGNLVGRQMLPVADHPRPVLLTESMGATVLRDLTGNVDLPRLASSGDAFWIAEHEDVPRTDPTFAKASMGPKTVAAEYEISRRMILQSAQSIEDLLRRDLQYLLRQALDGAAISGSGGVEPVGIIHTPGITAASAVFSSDLTADMIGALELDDLTGSRAFMTSPAVMTIARKVKDANEQIIPVADLFHQQRVEVSTQVVSDDVTPLPLLVYGQWSELVIGYWSGVDILANPYHSDVASKGGMLLHAFLDADVVVRTVEAFQARKITG